MRLKLENQQRDLDIQLEKTDSLSKNLGDLAKENEDLKNKLKAKAAETTKNYESLEDEIEALTETIREKNEQIAEFDISL